MSSAPSLAAGAGHLELAGQRLEYRHLGPGPEAAPTLILLHEGLGCVGLWRDFPDRLAAATGWGVFVYSRAGYGGSSPCAVPRSLRYMHEEALDTLPQVLDHIGVRQAVLLGHSDGASIAAIHAGGRKDPRVCGLILMAPHFITEDLGIAEIARAKEAYESGDLRARLARHHGDNVDCAFWGWNRAWLDPAFRAWDLRSYLPAITVPVLLLQGADDQYGTTLQLDIAEAGCTGPTKRRLLPACRHAPHRDQPEETLAAVTAFLSGLTLEAAISGQAEL